MTCFTSNIIVLHIMEDDDCRICRDLIGWGWLSCWKHTSFASDIMQVDLRI